MGTLKITFTNRTRKIGSFELGKETEKDKEKILSFHEESNLRPSDPAL